MESSGTVAAAGHGSSLLFQPRNVLPRSPSATAACRARAALTVNKREREERDFPDRKVAFPSEGREGQNRFVRGTQQAQSGSAASVPPAMPQPPEIPGTGKFPHPSANPSEELACPAPWETTWHRGYKWVTKQRDFCPPRRAGGGSGTWGTPVLLPPSPSDAG